MCSVYAGAAEQIEEARAHYAAPPDLTRPSRVCPTVLCREWKGQHAGSVPQSHSARPGGAVSLGAAGLPGTRGDSWVLARSDGGNRNVPSLRTPQCTVQSQGNVMAERRVCAIVLCRPAFMPLLRSRERPGQDDLPRRRNSPRRSRCQRHAARCSWPLGVSCRSPRTGLGRRHREASRRRSDAA
jgi:hypothetical protein